MKKLILLLLIPLVSFSQNEDILLNGSVSVEGNQIKNVADPTDPQDAVTKNYTYSKAEIDLLINEAIENLQSQINADVDNDGDGYTENQGDCDDNNSSIYPGAEEIEDGLDNNCDGEIDESSANGQIYNYTTFVQQPLGYGGGYSQSATQYYQLHQDISNIEQIKMFLQIDCPSTGCDDWDRFANIKVRDPNSNNWYEIGRYVTPYWVGTQQLERGLEFDVTDFKSILNGVVEIKIFIENWSSKADLVSLEFDYIVGTPDYPYYSVLEILNLHENSISGVPYGVSNNIDLGKNIMMPGNIQEATLRTIISGWGHATPYDSDGRPCAEWCYRTHTIKIYDTPAFEHYMGPIGCPSNPINNQDPGNWAPNRAGWCPGMVVPVRKNNLANTNVDFFSFEYELEPWVSDGNGGNAYYAISTYVIVKSNSPINEQQFYLFD